MHVSAPPLTKSQWYEHSKCDWDEWLSTIWDSLCKLFLCVFQSHHCEVPYHWTSVKGRTHTHFIDAWISNESTKHIWAPSLTEVQRYSTLSTAMQSESVQRYGTGICDRIIFDFYTELSHLYSILDYHMCGSPEQKPDVTVSHLVYLHHHAKSDVLLLISPHFEWAWAWTVSVWSVTAQRTSTGVYSY